MRHASVIELDDTQRQKLVKLAQSNTTEVRLARRAGIVLLAADGFDNYDIGTTLDQPPHPTLSVIVCCRQFQPEYV